MGIVDDALVTLEQRGLVRLAVQSGRGHHVDLFHDLVRAAAWGSLPNEALALAHSGLCDALVAQRDVAPARLVRHYVGAGRDAEAADVAALAARDALDKHAYALSLELLDVAFRVPPSNPSPLLGMRAHAFESFGQYAEAATVYAELATCLPYDEARAARLAEASALLAAGNIVEGRVKADALLALGGGVIAATWARGLAVARFLLGPRDLFVSDDARTAESSANERLEAEREEQLASIATTIDPLAGLVHILRARRRLDRVGAISAAALCDFQLAYLAYFAEPRGGAVPLAQRYRASGEARLAHAARTQGGRPLRAAAVAFPTFLLGVDHERLGRPREAAKQFEDALAMVAGLEQNGTYEQMMICVHRCAVALHAGDIVSGKRYFKALSEANGGHSASALRCFVEVGALDLAVLDGTFEAGADRGARALESHPKGASLQSAILHFVVGSFGAYMGDPIEGRRRVVVHLRENARFRVSENMYAARYGGKLALLFARARRAGDLTVTRREMAKLATIARRAPPTGSTAAPRAYAYVEEADGGDPVRIVARFAEAEAIAATRNEPLDAATARYQRGLRLGGDEGQRLKEHARATLAALGVSLRLLDECAV